MGWWPTTSSRSRTSQRPRWKGRCPALLRDFLEVRGLGLLNIRTIFGETAVRPKMKLKLIATWKGRSADALREARERLPLAELSEDILGVTVRKVVIPVAEGAQSRGAGRGRGAQLHPAAARRRLDGRVHAAAEAGDGGIAARARRRAGSDSMQLILVSGLSGSGKSIALDVLEDAGFYCIDKPARVAAG
jgi:hypothetical protein